MKNCLPKILIVDDRPANLVAMKKMLTGLEAELICADSGNAALGLTLEHQFALCLLDVMMPNMNGFETAELMRQNEATMNMPIIFVTAMDKSETHLFKGYASGAVDYLYKPVVKEVLLAKVRIFLDIECRQQDLRKANEIIIEQNKILESRVSTDGLTGLSNHVHFQELFNREYDLAVRHNHEITVLMCDLDYFKDVNDTYGHQVGDVVLREFAEILQGQTRITDILARYGGEEFIMALPNTDLAGGCKVAEKIRTLAEKHTFIHGKASLQVTVSIGVATLNDEIKHSQHLIEQADSSLYKAKASGRNRVVSCQEELECEIEEFNGDSFAQIRHQLQNTLEKNKALALASFEALVHNRLKDVTPLKERNDNALRLVNLMGKRLNLPQEMMQTFRRSFKLHDLFRLYVDDTALNNNEDLTLTEQQAIYNQPLMMKEVTELFDFFANERQILLYHHEYYNGNGYPEGMEGEEIPLGSRIFALVDSIVAMDTPSYPRAVMRGEQLIGEVKKQSGKQFDPILVDLMVEILKEEY